MQDAMRNYIDKRDKCRIIHTHSTSLPLMITHILMIGRLFRTSLAAAKECLKCSAFSNSYINTASIPQQMRCSSRKIVCALIHPFMEKSQPHKHTTSLTKRYYSLQLYTAKIIANSIIQPYICNIPIQKQPGKRRQTAAEYNTCVCVSGMFERGQID